MLKLLRQYNQWILVVGGTLLLITFLMPSAIQGLAQRSAVSGATWATYSGGTVTGADLEQAQQELRVIELLGNQTLAFLGADKEPAHWWLLVHEAKLAGLVGGLGDGEAILAQMSAGQNVSAQQALFNLVKASGTNGDIVLETLSKMQGVMRLVNLSVAVDRVSDRRLKQSVARSLLAVSGDMVIIDARSNATIEVATPGDDKLNEQLRKFADTARPAETAIGLDKFGYKVPDRFKLEWISISKAAVAAAIANSPELTTLSLKKRFAQNPSKYGAADASNFAAFETVVRTAATDEIVKERLDEISKFAGDQLGLAQRSLKRDGAYFLLPADWSAQMPSLQALTQTIAAEFGVAAPTYQSSGEAWTTATELEAIPGLGFARTDKFGTPVRVAQLVGAAKEFGSPNLATPFQLNIASPAFVSDSGDVHFVRMIAAEPSKAASNLADVRAQVEKDVLALERFNWLEANKASIASQAAAEGIRAVATKFGATVEFAKDVAETNPQFLRFGIRMGTGLPTLNNDPKAIAAIIDAASKIPFAADMNSVPVAERTVAVAVPDKLSMVVLQVTAMTPVTEEKYGELAADIQTPNGASLVSVTRDPALAIDPKSLFGYDALAKRFDFKQTRDESEIPTSGAPVPPLDPAS